MKRIYLREDKKRVSAHSRLAGKVVLLIGNDTVVLQALTQQLAEKGVDIALVGRQLLPDTYEQMRQYVESLGQRFFYISEKDLALDTDTHNSFVSQIIHLVTSRLGQLDVFIDLSAQKETRNNVQSQADSLRSSWPLRQTIFEELATN